MNRQNLMLGVALALLAVAGVVFYQQLMPPPDPYANVTGPIFFNDLAETNASATPDQLDLTFRDAAGKTWRVSDLRGKKHVVLVMTRGYYQARCPYCTAQTSRLITNYGQFAERNAEVLVVYPGPQNHLQEFLDAVAGQAQQASIPFPLLFDEDMKAVDRLGIRWQLARPSTFILDRDGNLKFAYIGKDIADRPSINAMLRQLDKLSPPAEKNAAEPMADVPSPSPAPDAGTTTNP